MQFVVVRKNTLVESLTEDEMLIILKSLDRKSLTGLAQTCRHLSEECKKEYLWNDFIADFGPSLDLEAFFLMRTQCTDKASPSWQTGNAHIDKPSFYSIRKHEPSYLPDKSPYGEYAELKGVCWFHLAPNNAQLNRGVYQVYWRIGNIIPSYRGSLSQVIFSSCPVKAVKAVDVDKCSIFRYNEIDYNPPNNEGHFKWVTKKTAVLRVDQDNQQIRIEAKETSDFIWKQGILMDMVAFRKISDDPNVNIGDDFFDTIPPPEKYLDLVGSNVAYHKKKQ